MSKRPSWKEIAQSLGMPTGFVAPDERAEIEKSGLFDPEWYSAQLTPEMRVPGFDPVDHYLSVGRQARHAPGPGLDPAWYLQSNNDVALSGLDPLMHYIRVGRREGRLPKAPARSLFDDFQSLGSNCEFGMVQRHFGCELLTLFGFATTSMRGLLTVLSTDVDLFQSLDALQMVVADDGEYLVRQETYGFLFHTYVRHETLEPGPVREHELQRLRYLERKFNEDLEKGGRIFVFKMKVNVQARRVAKLAALLRRRSQNHLLWVTQADGSEPPGTVKLIGPGLMQGTVDRFDMLQPSFASWAKVCQDAHDLRSRAK